MVLRLANPLIVIIVIFGSAKEAHHVVSSIIQLIRTLSGANVKETVMVLLWSELKSDTRVYSWGGLRIYGAGAARQAVLSQFPE